MATDRGPRQPAPAASFEYEKSIDCNHEIHLSACLTWCDVMWWGHRKHTPSLNTASSITGDSDGNINKKQIPTKTKRKNVNVPKMYNGEEILPLN